MINTEYKKHIGLVNDGAIVCFPHSACYYMKVCDRYGKGAVVRLLGGEYISKADLEKDGLGLYCKIVADDIDRLYYCEEE